jgi:hypothetical protein
MAIELMGRSAKGVGLFQSKAGATDQLISSVNAKATLVRDAGKLHGQLPEVLYVKLARDGAAAVVPVAFNRDSFDWRADVDLAGFPEVQQVIVDIKGGVDARRLFVFVHNHAEGLRTEVSAEATEVQ